MSQMTSPLISIIVPVFNEEQNIDRAYREISSVFEDLKDRYDYEIIFTDNHSTDRSFEILKALCEKDKRVRVLRLARNFGFQKSILTGYRFAQGAAAIQIDCDLEDPPSLFVNFIELWEAGHDVVFGIRIQRQEGRLMIATRRLFYRILYHISKVPQPLNAGDFRLLDRRMLDQLRAIDDAQPYVRGLISELARNQIGIEYARSGRQFGESKFPIRRLLSLAIDGVTSYSVVPLRIASVIGLFVAFVTLILSFFYVIGRVFFALDWPPGFTTLAVLSLFGISLNGMFLGIIGEYIGRIYNQVRKRPLSVIEQAVNLSEETGKLEARQRKYDRLM